MSPLFARIEFGGAGQSRPVFEYTYNHRGLPVTLTEKQVDIVSELLTAALTFTYDNRGRLIAEERTVFPQQGGVGPYHFQYEYDPGGNRTAKIDVLHEIAVQYEYDIHDVPTYGTANNRLMKYETWDTGGTESTLITTTYYYYNDLGNVTRIVSHDAGSDVYDATRFGYARNGASVSFVLGETWLCSGEPCVGPTDYAVTYARQFRYDGARQRYLNRELDPVALQTSGTLGEIGSTWSEYDGDIIYGDRELINGNLQNTASYEPGIGKFSWMDDGSGTWVPDGSDFTSYYHSDLIGTTRYLSAVNNPSFDPVVYTAFGERIDGFNHRYGYAGAWGYQSHSFSEVSPPLDPDAVFPYLHVGARYYDPTSGRFLQRDPIGIRGGSNVFQYVGNTPTDDVDPEGLRRGGGGRPPGMPPGAGGPIHKLPGFFDKIDTPDSPCRRIRQTNPANTCMNLGLYWIGGPYIPPPRPPKPLCRICLENRKSQRSCQGHFTKPRW